MQSVDLQSFDAWMKSRNLGAATLNVVLAGIGGQGVLKASDILVDVAFAAGLDVKKSEVHGMSQRGGSVHSDVRFGPEVFSPMVPAGEADFLLVMDAEEVPVNRHRLRPGGRLIEPATLGGAKLPHPRSLNVALLGRLSRELPFPPEAWEASLRRRLPPLLVEINLAAFALGRRA
jgi:indolepyruvate ferredoxin oxidoreductase, beta subunit